MSNIEDAKKALQENSQLESILNPQPGGTKQKKIKLPLKRDVEIIENILRVKLDDKKKKAEEKIHEEAKIKWGPRMDEIHLKAIILRKEADKLLNEIKKSSGGTIISANDGRYNDTYWDRLPVDMKEAQEDEYIDIDRDGDTAFRKTIEDLKLEIDEFIVNMKIGLAPMADVKIYLDKISKL